MDLASKVNYTGLMTENGHEPFSYETLRNIFASSCVESAALKQGVSSNEMFSRMSRVGLFKDLIYPCYETLHSQSREIVTEDILEALRIREDKLKKLEDNNVK